MKLKLQIPTILTTLVLAATTDHAAGLMNFSIQSASQLVNELLNSNGQVEIKDVSGSPILANCAAMFTNGHSLGNLYQKNPLTNQTAKDVNGNYIPTDPPVPLVPDVGIILSSGNPLDFNHNDLDDTTTIHNSGGDFDLKKSVDASNGWNNAVFDACVLEFKFRCTNEAFIPQVSFNYIWGSEEYYEYVDSAFNDVFGFYLNGENIARLPETTTSSDIVSINNVNYKRNNVYFHGNDPGTGWEMETDPDAPPSEVVYQSIEADGFTDMLEAKGTPFQDHSKWNTIKLAVGDVGDSILDSWVLLEAASFSCVDVTNAPSVSLEPSKAPTDAPSISSKPTLAPSLAPTLSTSPSQPPSLRPTTSTMPSLPPSLAPSISSSPTDAPSFEPSVTSAPSGHDSLSPSISSQPTDSPSLEPSISSKPTGVPSLEPTLSSKPTGVPSLEPTLSSGPSVHASDSPSLSTMPTLEPSDGPSISSKP
ncbi:hypothetical protein ACHAXR_006465, partial [Thalassiosira sp. AJA248-18]